MLDFGTNERLDRLEAAVAILCGRQNFSDEQREKFWADAEKLVEQIKADRQTALAEMFAEARCKPTGG